MGFFFNTEPQPNQPQQGHPQQQVAVAAPQGAPSTQEGAHTHQVPSTKPQTISSILGTNEFDASKLSPLPGLDKKTLDYFSLEESGSNRTTAFGLIPSRSWTDDVCYGTGAVYLLGLGVGGLWGAREELKASKGQPSKVRYNRMLNGMTRRGPFLGNSMGILGN
jgi:import inner membrane translocase subunit TIM23